MTVKRPMPSHFGSRKPLPGLFIGTCRKGHELFETGDRSLLEKHMVGEHKEAKYGLGMPLRAKPSWARKPNWKPPKLTVEGTPFTIEAFKPGATVTWMQGDSSAGAEVLRSGQVWSAGWAAKSVWVIPFERREGEAAVLLVPLSSGRMEVYSTQNTRVQAAAS